MPFAITDHSHSATENNRQQLDNMRGLPANIWGKGGNIGVVTARFTMTFASKAGTEIARFFSANIRKEHFWFASDFIWLKSFCSILFRAKKHFLLILPNLFNRRFTVDIIYGRSLINTFSNKKGKELSFENQVLFNSNFFYSFQGILHEYRQQCSSICLFKVNPNSFLCFLHCFVL